METALLTEQGKQDGVREKNGTKSVAAKASAKPTGGSGAGMALGKCFELRRGVGSLYCHT